MTQLIVGLSVLAIGGALFAYAFSNWRQAMLGVLLLVVFEGALRKWVLPQASDVLYFLKDFLLIPIYLQVMERRRSRQDRIGIPPILGLLFALNAVWCLIQVFNSRLGSPLVGLLGLRAYIYYIPLIWAFPQLFADQAALLRFLRIYLLLTIPIGILGVVQYFSPITSPINTYVEGVEAYASVGANVRITGTFSFISGYATYLTVTFALLLASLFTPQPRMWRWITLTELVLVVTNSLMTGSRSVIFVQIFTITGLILVNGLFHPRLSVSILAKLLVPGVILSASLFFVFEQALDNFIYRASNADNVVERSIDSIVQPFTLVQYTGLDGHGIGATLPGGPVLSQALGLPLSESIPVGFETEPGRVMLELGPFGFLLWYGLRIYLLFLLWQVFRRLRTAFLKHLVLAALLVNTAMVNGSLVVNPTFIVYYWFLNSFILLLPTIEGQGASYSVLSPNQANELKTSISRPSYRQPQFP